MALRFTLRSSAAVLAATIATALSGCAVGGSFDSAKTAVTAATPTGFMNGKVHGGNQPIVGATVTLWAAGSAAAGGGYGKGATAVAVASPTDANGSFTFNNSSGTSPCTIGQYLYITATGGNTGSGANPYSALMAALPTPCSATTGATYVWLNEVTTVAAIWPLQQFMSINPAGNGTTTPYWQIGTPGSNLAGMANAFAETSQLANIATGTSQQIAVTNTLASVLYTTLVNPDTQRINLLADILADCVNTAGTSVCTSLFTAVTPNGATAPGDTIQAAYYLATNPAGLTMPIGTAANAPTNQCNSFVTSSPPFPTTLVCGTNTNDWLIGVSWKTTNAGGTTVGTLDAASIAIDGTGNVWIGAGSGVAAGGAIINEFNHFGQMILNPVGSVTIPAYNVNYVVTGTGTATAYPGSTNTLGYGRPFSLAIDTNNNAWFNSFGATTPGTYGTLPTGILAEVTPTNQTGVGAGYIVASLNGPLAIDGSNNLYMNDQPVSGRYYLSELTAASNYQTFDEGTGRTTGSYNSVFVDNSLGQYAWGLATPSSTCTLPSTIDRANSAMSASGTSTTSITDATSCTGAGAPDAAGNAWATYGGNLYYINIGTSITAPTVTTVTGSTNTSATGTAGTAGLDNAAGVAIDGAGNVWVANRPSSSVVGGLSLLVPSTSNGTTTVTALSETGGTGEFGFQVDGAVAVNGVVIDNSGNVWIDTTGGSFAYHMVGAAAPVVTPTALAVANGTIGAKP